MALALARAYRFPPPPGGGHRQQRGFNRVEVLPVGVSELLFVRGQAAK